MTIAAKEGDARGNAVPRLTSGIDEALCGRLTRGSGDPGNRRVLYRDPRLVLRGKMAEAIAQRVWSTRCERGQRLHAKFDITDILIRLDAFDFCSRKEIRSRAHV